MTVSELIELLQTLPQQAQVIVSRDSEGNSFSPISPSWSKGVYFPDTSWTGDFIVQPPNVEDDPEGAYEEEREEWIYERHGEKPPSICLWPVA